MNCIKHMKKYILIIGLLIYCISNCYSQNSNKYKIEIEKDISKTDSIIADDELDNELLNDGNLYFHFQTDFKNDTAKISVNGKLYDIYELTTDDCLGLARVIKIPNFKTIKKISIIINEGEEAIFEIEKTNQIIVRLSEETLFIEFYKHLPYYD